MWLQVPKCIENTLWEAPLEPTDQKSVNRLTRDWAARGLKGDARAAIRDLPIVSIGKPEVWSLGEIYPPDKMPPLLQAKLEEADFYLVRFACSFRTRRKKVEVEWARFSINLLPDHTGRRPIAYDLHPILVTQEVRRNVRVSLSPTLKFQEVKARVGEVAFGIEYPELQPIISATGAGESEPSWDYEGAKGAMVQGSKWMHLLFRVYKGMERVRAILDLAADVQVYGSHLPVVTQKGKRRSRLTVQLV